MPIVRIKYFPEEATSSDVRRFFRKIEIPDGGVHIVGGPKGIVFVRLYDREDLEIALKRDGKKLSPAQCEYSFKVKVSESNEDQMKKVIADITSLASTSEKDNPPKGPREVTPPPKNDFFVRLADLAPIATVEDIVQFFDGIRIALVKQTDSGSALIKFKSVDDKQEALTYDQKFFGSRFIKVNHLGSDVWESCKADTIRPVYPSVSDSKEVETEEQEGTETPQIESQCVMLSGLAPEVTKKDLVHELLKACKITKYGLYMETQDSKCTGKCYVEFVDQATRDRAILKADKSEFRGNTVSLEAITAEDMKNRVQHHRKELKKIEYDRRKEAKSKKRKRKEDIGKREERVKEEEKERERLKTEMLKELEKTSTKHKSPSKHKSPKKSKRPSSPPKKINSPSPSPTASSKNTTTSSEDEGLSALFAPKGASVKPLKPVTGINKPAIKIKMNLSTTSNSNEPEEESVLKRLQQEQEANEQKSLKKELKKKSEEAETATNTMGLMLMSNIMTNMMTLQNSQKNNAATNPPPLPPPEPSPAEPPTLQNQYQHQAYMQLQSQTNQLPNNLSGSSAPQVPTLPPNYNPNSQLYQAPPAMQAQHQPRPPKAMRFQNPAARNAPQRYAAPRMPVPMTPQNLFNTSVDNFDTSPQKNRYHQTLPNRGRGVQPRSVRPQALSGNYPNPGPRGGGPLRPTGEQNYGTPNYGNQNYNIRGGGHQNNGPSNGGSHQNRGGHQMNGNRFPNRGGYSYRGSPKTGFGGQAFDNNVSYGAPNKARPVPMSQNGYSGGQTFNDQSFHTPRGGCRGAPHRGGFQQRGRSWMGGPRFR